MDRYLCLQDADAVREQIESGILRPGDKVPARAELADELQVHTSTVGQDLQILETQGAIWRCPGLVYYVGRAPASARRQAETG
jgi:DNA-binding GntR family transcriptional regulator